MRAFAADMLAELALKVIETSSGPEALGLLADGTGIDLIVSDQPMPGMAARNLPNH